MRYICYACSVSGAYCNHWDGINTTAPAELEQLVKRVNDGYKAHDIIRDRYPKAVLLNGKVPDWTPGSREFTVKPPTPAFEPFKLSTGHEVRMEDKLLRIGCQTFNPEGLLVGLKGICNWHHFAEFKAYREGVGRTDRTGAEVTWADVDLVIAALEKIK